MFRTIAGMYVTLVPVICSGIANMIFCKLPVCGWLNIPIDDHKTLSDGRRIYGDNKTWKGFHGYVVFHILFNVLWGEILRVTNMEAYSFFYVRHENTFFYNLIVGWFLGLAYAMFELPNSLLKRRLDISPGKPPKGALKWLFVFLDQADSVFGIALVVWMFYDLGIKRYVLYVVLGAATHLFFNVVLYFMHLRKNPF